MTPISSLTPSLTPSFEAPLHTAVYVTITPASLEITRTPTSVPAGLSNVPDGEYILYVHENTGILSLISIDGNYRMDLSFIKDKFEKISLDNNKWVFVSDNPLKIQNLENMNIETVEFDLVEDCSDYPDIFLDDQTFVIACNYGQFRGSREIFSFSKDGKQKMVLTNCELQGGDCIYPSFSPDGKWLSYFWMTDFLPGSQIEKYAGLHIAPSECIHSSEGCQKVSVGPLTTLMSYFWLPDTPYLVVWGADQDQDHLYDLYAISEDGTMKEEHFLDKAFKTITQKIENSSDPVFDLLLSKDKTQLVYNDHGIITLIDTTTGGIRTLPIRDYITLLAWIKVVNGKIIH